MKQKLKENGKTILMSAGIIAVTAAVIITALVYKNKNSGPSEGKYGATVTLCDYKNIPLTLEKSEITDEDVETTAQWSIDYYNQSISSDDDAEELSLDTLTDEQVKTAFGAETVDEFYANIKEQREENDKQTQRSTAYEQICDYLIENCTIENFPEDKCRERLEKYIADTTEQCETNYDMTFAEYCESTGMTEEEYTKSLSEHTERSFKLEIIFTAIGDKEGIEYDEDAFDEYVNSLVENGGYESVDAVYEQYEEDYLKTAYRVEYITDWLIEKADITYTDPEETSETEDEEYTEPEAIEPIILEDETETEE